MRLLLLAALLPLSACGEAAPEPVPEDRRIACALDGEAEFRRVCSFGQEGERITLRRPDGGFRRILAGSEGIEAADGAEPARVDEIAPDLVEIAIGRDRYRLPVEPR